MHGRVVALLLALSSSFALLPVVSAAEPLPPLEPRVVDVPSGGMVEVALLAEPWNGSGAWPVLVAGGVVEGGPVDVTLFDGDREIGSWDWTGDDSLSIGTAAARNATGALTLRISAEARNASVYAYFDAPCACPSKQAPFPGGVVLFHVPLASGDAARANVSGGEEVRASYRVVRVVDAGEPLAPVATAGPPTGIVEWTAPVTSTYALLAKSSDGVAPLEVSFDVVSPRAQTPGPTLVALVGVAVAVAVIGRRLGPA